MDDRLQRRLRAADPLSADDGLAPAADRLDAIKEQIMQTEQAPVRAALRPRPIGIAAFAAVALAAVLVAGALVRPGSTALAWSPDPTPVSDAEKAAAYTACTDGVPVVAGGGAVPGTERPQAPAEPAVPTSFPPLVSLELHGNGGVAILADDATVGFCLLKREPDGDFVYGGLMLGPTAGGVPDALDVSGMSTEFEDTTLSIIAGTAPAGVATVRLDGGPGDGSTATVTAGRFATWVPGPLMGEDVELVALDAAGAEVARQTLSRAGEEPVEIRATPSGEKPQVVEVTPAP